MSCLTREKRKAFLKLPIAERRRIMEDQADKMLSLYQEDTEWKELMAGDIIDYVHRILPCVEKYS